MCQLMGIFVQFLRKMGKFQKVFKNNINCFVFQAITLAVKVEYSGIHVVRLALKKTERVN